MPTRPPRHRPVMTLGHQQHVDPEQFERAVKAATERARKAVLDKNRPNARRRGYDRLWEKVRDQQLAAFPICSVAGCGQVATVVDHIQAIADRPDLRLDPSNHRSMCKPCHDRHTARTQGFAKRRPTAPQGR